MIKIRVLKWYIRNVQGLYFCFIGVIGDWKNTFTVAQNELFDDIYRKQLEGITLDLMYDSNF